MLIISRLSNSAFFSNFCLEVIGYGIERPKSGGFSDFFNDIFYFDNSFGGMSQGAEKSA